MKMFNMISKIKWDEYGNPILSSNETNKIHSTINVQALRHDITMYLDDLDYYGTDDEVNKATDVLWDFVKYIEAMSV
jgi:hypothetical protein